MEFEHRDTDVASILDRVWRTSNDASTVMTSAARTSPHLILAWSDGRLSAGFRGPETKASIAHVPAQTEYLGIRFALGARIPIDLAEMVDGYVPVPVRSRGRGSMLIGGEEFEVPTFENVEHFVMAMQRAGIAGPTAIDEDNSRRESVRSRQRRFRVQTGLTRSTVTQIDRANAAATLLRSGVDWPAVVQRLGFYDQAHLSHAMRRFIGRTVSELRAGAGGPMSFLYKTDSAAGS